MSDFLFFTALTGLSNRINESSLSSMFMKQNHRKSYPAPRQECVLRGKPRPHRALSVKRSNHSFEQLFFLSPATFSYHPLVPHQPDLLPVFMSWPVYRKLKLICPLPRVEIVGNPTVSELSNCFDSSPPFFFFPSLPPFSPPALETVLCV